MVPTPLPDPTQKYDTLLLWPTKVYNNWSDLLPRLQDRGEDSTLPLPSLQAKAVARRSASTLSGMPLGSCSAEFRMNNTSLCKAGRASLTWLWNSF